MFLKKDIGYFVVIQMCSLVNPPVRRAPMDSPHKGSAMWNFDALLALTRRRFEHVIGLSVIRDAITLRRRHRNAK